MEKRKYTWVYESMLRQGVDPWHVHKMLTTYLADLQNLLESQGMSVGVPAAIKEVTALIGATPAS
jgi:hypothetical protein